MRLKIVQYYTQGYKTGIYSEKINKEYCKLYDIDYFCEKDEKIIQNAIESEGYTKQWYKIHLIKKELLTNNYDYVIFIDADAAIVNFNVDILRFINKAPDKDLIIGSDMNSRKYHSDPINTGVMIFKNTKWSVEFLEKVWSTANEIHRGIFRYDLWHEQTIISILLHFVKSDMEKVHIINYNDDLSLNDPVNRPNKTFIFHDIDKDKLHNLK